MEMAETDLGRGPEPVVATTVASAEIVDPADVGIDIALASAYQIAQPGVSAMFPFFHFCIHASPPTSF